MLNSFPKKITDKFTYHFSVKEFGLYAITLVASCRSGQQIGQGGGEDLWVEIDGRKFREVPALAKPQYQDIPLSWNGSQLKGLGKTVVFLLLLDLDNHQVEFISDKGAIIEIEPQIKLITDYKNIQFDIGQKAENGDRRSWFTFALIDLPLKSFSADITVNYRFRDSDDVKLLVDNMVKKNTFSILHRDWLWSANILTKIFKKERQKKTFEENLPKDIHYIDFWADRTPILHEVVLDLGVNEIKRISTMENPKWTGKFEDDTELIIMARMILGEGENQKKEAKIGLGHSVLNRIKKHKKHWGYTIHEVILKEFQYDSFWNTDTKNKVKDPLHNNVSRSIWNESYGVAEAVLNGKVTDPTFGATHFHTYKHKSDFPWWATENNFKIKIDKIYFYELEA